jgi:MFS family permease
VREPATSSPAAQHGRTIIAATICVAALGWFPTTALVIALPRVEADFGTPVDELGWVPNAYTLAVAAVLIAAGRISDRYGRRRCFLWGSLAFTIATALAAIAPSFAVLLVTVALSGVAGALMFTSSLAILKVGFDGRRQVLAIGLWAAATNLGQALGSPIGGLLEDSALGWRSIFWLAIPFGLFAALVGWRWVAESYARSPAPIDVAGALSVGAAVVLLVVAGMQGPEWGWLAPGTLAVLAGAALAVVAAVVAQRQAREPILPPAAIGDRVFLSGTAINGLANVCFSALLFLSPLFLEDALGESPAHAGVLLLALTGTVVVGATVGGRLVAPNAAPVLLAVASALLVVGVLLSASLDADSTYADLLPGWIVAGAGIGLIASVALNAALARVPAAIAGSATGVFAAAALLGGTFGVTIASALFDAFSGDTDPAQGDAAAIADGISSSLYVVAALAALAVALSLALLRGRRDPAGSERVEAGHDRPSRIGVG